MELIFSEQDPVPFVLEEQCTYEVAKAHAMAVDAWLGFRFEDVERERVSQAAALATFESWAHLSPQAFQTPYVELRQIVSLLALREGECLVDLGCAYARLAFVLGWYFPRLKFLGVEACELRVREALRVLGERGLAESKGLLQVLVADVTAAEFAWPVARAYFIYDFGTEAAVHSVLERLRLLARGPEVAGDFFVVARGRRTHQVIHGSHSWLGLNLWRQTNHFTIFRSR